LIDIAEALEEIVLICKSVKKACKLLGVSDSYINQHRQFIRMSPEVIKLARERKIDHYSVMQSLARIPRDIVEEVAIEVAGLPRKKALEITEKFAVKGGAI